MPEGDTDVYKRQPVHDPLGDLAARYARGHGPFTAEHFAAWLGIGLSLIHI